MKQFKQKLVPGIKEFFKNNLGTLIIFVLAVVFVIWGVFSIMRAKENAITFSEDYKAPKGNVDSEDPGKYVSVAKTDSLELFYNSAKGTIQVKNLKTGKLWKGVCDEEVYDMTNINKQWAAYLQSPITISYNDMKKKDSGVVKRYAANFCDILEDEPIENGISVTYGFTTPGIYVTIEYVLEDDNLTVRIPYEKIREEYKFALQTMEILPFFGAAGNDQDGYLFYPEGSGAITTFAKADTRPSNVLAATFYTYTHRSVAFMNLFDEDLYNRYTASMPVFGIKNGDEALFAVFSKGAENSGIVVSPSGVVVNLNRIGFEVYTRNIYNVNMYSMSTGSGTAATGALIQRLDKQIIPEDREIRYFFLAGEDADYSGMAATYRDYLIENGMLNDAVAEGDELPLALRLLMGTTKEGMIFDEYIPMTTFEQAQRMVESLRGDGVSALKVTLESWMKGYDEYEYWGPASQLGGQNGLKDFNDYADKAEGVDAYLENGFLFASSDTSGLDETHDVVYDGLQVEVSVENMDGTIFYLVNPLAAYDRNNKFLNKLEGYRSLGVAYDDIGKYAFPDFNEGATFTKSGTVEQFCKLLASTKESRKVASMGANQYVYAYSDYLYGLRENSYGLNITDYAVPFVEMVLSGRVPYATEGAGNLSYDLQYQKLKWIEYGSMPYFYLTAESALNLRDTGFDTLFSSTFSDWEQTAVDVYTELKQNLGAVYGQQMVDHKFITDDLVRIEYANGIAVYINYGNEDARADGVKVPARDYVVVGGR